MAYDVNNFIDSNAHHVMVDLETLGTTSSAPIISIGALFFNPRTGAYDSSNAFKQAVNPQTCINAGADPAVDAFTFWMSQPKEAQDHYNSLKKRPIKEVMNDFRKWLRWNPITESKVEQHDHKLWLWSAATFDGVILNNTYKYLGSEVPWQRRNLVDLRTYRIMALALGIEDITVDMPDSHIIHDPVEDCIRQVRQVIKIEEFFKTIRK